MGSLWNRSGVIERYGADDLPARNAKAYFFNGETTSPLTVYADGGEASALPHPVVADSNGRWPNIFVPYVLSYDVQVVNEFNTLLTYTQGIPNPDPVELTVTPPPGGESPAALSSGMTHWEPVQGTKVGFVRCNGRTIGNAVSGASERANADCQSLFSYLWTALANAQAPVIGGRGVSAVADFTAGKQITLPDFRGAMPVGLDDMGNSAAGLLANVPIVSGGATTSGSIVGATSYVLTTSNIPVHTHPFIPAAPHLHGYTRYSQLLQMEWTPSTTSGTAIWNGTTTASTGTANPGGSVGPGPPQGGPSPPEPGGLTPVSNVPRAITGTWYMKL